LTALLPVLVTVRLAVSPPCHSFFVYVTLHEAVPPPVRDGLADGEPVRLGDALGETLRDGDALGEDVGLLPPACSCTTTME